jgi:hypothetical protein
MQQLQINVDNHHVEALHFKHRLAGSSKYNKQQ